MNLMQRSWCTRAAEQQHRRETATPSGLRLFQAYHSPRRKEIVSQASWQRRLLSRKAAWQLAWCKAAILLEATQVGRAQLQPQATHNSEAHMRPMCLLQPLVREPTTRKIWQRVPRLWPPGQTHKCHARLQTHTTRGSMLATNQNTDHVSKNDKDANGAARLESPTPRYQHPVLKEAWAHLACRPPTQRCL